MHLEIFHMVSETERDLEYRRAERRAPHLDLLATEHRGARGQLSRRLRGQWRALRAVLAPLRRAGVPCRRPGWPGTRRRARVPHG
jgi:hypothetical protein